MLYANQLVKGERNLSNNICLNNSKSRKQINEINGQKIIINSFFFYTQKYMKSCHTVCKYLCGGVVVLQTTDRIGLLCWMIKWCLCCVVADMMEDSHFNSSYFWSPVATVPGQVRLHTPANCHFIRLSVERELSRATNMSHKQLVVGKDHSNQIIRIVWVDSG